MSREQQKLITGMLYRKQNRMCMTVSWWVPSSVYGGVSWSSHKQTWRASSSIFGLGPSFKQSNTTAPVSSQQPELLNSTVPFDQQLPTDEHRWRVCSLAIVLRCLRLGQPQKAAVHVTLGYSDWPLNTVRIWSNFKNGRLRLVEWHLLGHHR